MLNGRCEQKSAATLTTYRYRLACFSWFCQENEYPVEPRKLTVTKRNQVKPTGEVLKKLVDNMLYSESGRKRLTQMREELKK